MWVAGVAAQEVQVPEVLAGFDVYAFWQPALRLGESRSHRNLTLRWTAPAQAKPASSPPASVQ